MARTPILEKVIKETIRRIEKSLLKLDEVLGTFPRTALFELGYESTKKADELQRQKKFKEAAQVLEAAEKEKRRLKRIERKLKNRRALYDEKYLLEKELEELKRELNKIEWRKQHSL